MPERILLRPGRVTLADLRRAGRMGVKLEFPATARRRLAAGERALARRLERDRLLAPDIAAVKTLVLEGGFLEFVPAGLRFCM